MPHSDLQSSSPSSHPNVCASHVDTPKYSPLLVKNRRTIYLNRHPSYFTSTDLEMSGCKADKGQAPILYDRCIRRFLSAAEREEEGKRKGYPGVLEAGLLLGEARQKEGEGFALASQIHDQVSHHAEMTESKVKDSKSRAAETSLFIDDSPVTKDEGFEVWKFEMTMRFLKGEDRDFDYEAVDANEDLDGVRVREDEDKWFEEEEPEWIGNKEGKD